MWTVKFWKDATERAIKTAAQSALLIVGGDTLDVFHADWKAIIGGAAGGAVLSVLSSLVSTLRGDNESASAVKTP